MSTPVTGPQPQPVPGPPPSSRRHPVLRYLGIVLAVLIFAIAGIVWYTTTAGFQARVRRQVIATLEKTTGGRVELAAFHWHLLHLEIEADDLTIHGLEGPGEAPYAHIDRLFVRAKIISLFRAKIGLNYLAADHPVIHIIVYPDGSTNQPRPRTQSSNTSGIDTFFDLAIDHAELGNGLAIFNQRAVPFNLSANDIGLTLNYVPAKDHYLANLHVSNLSAERGRRPAFHSNLAVQVDMGRDSVVLSSMQLQSGEDTLQANGSVNNFKDPQWLLHSAGRIDVRTIEDLTAIAGLQAGVIDLAVDGHGSMSKFSANGQAKVTGAAYKMPGADLSGVDASTLISITDQELALTQLKAHLAPGGTLTGEMHLVNWLPQMAPARPAPAASPVKKKWFAKKSKTTQRIAAAPRPVAPAIERGIIRAEVRNVKLETIMKIVAPKRYQDLGFDTEAAGKVAVDWTGNAADLTTKAVVQLSPPRPPTPAEVPLTGTVDAQYFNRGGRVEIKQLDVQTPATNIHVEGQLGVYPVAQASALQAQLTTSNLGEFNRTLIALGLTVNGKSGVQAIPVLLHGQAEFQGTVTGTIVNPDVKGHLVATNFDTTFFVTPSSGSSVTIVPRPSSTASAPSTVSPARAIQSATAADVNAARTTASDVNREKMKSAPSGGSTPENTPGTMPTAALATAPSATLSHGAVVTPAAVTAHSPAISPINPPTAAPGLQNLHWDRLEADAEYSPLDIAVGRATLTRGATVIHASGVVHPHVLGEGKSTFDSYSGLNAQFDIQKEAVSDLLVMAGTSLPVTGTLDLQAHAGGTLGNLSGSGNLIVQGGTIYGEPYHSLSAQLRFAGHDVEVSSLTFLQNGGKLTGDGGFDLASNAFHFNAQGTGFELAHIQQLQAGKMPLSGSLSFDAKGSGTVAAPMVNANLHLNNLMVAGQPAGSIEATAHTDRQTLFLKVTSTLNAARLEGDGQVRLTGNYETRAHVTVSQLDITPFLKAYSVQGLTSPSMVGVNANIQGPLKMPRNMGGDLTLNQFSVAVGGVPLQTDGSLHVQLHDGVLHLDPVHVTGDDTNLHAQGTIDVFQTAHTMNLQANGAINIKLLQTINPGVTSSGHVDFTVEAAGTMQKPDLKGQVKFTNVAVALEDVPNGLSQMNGTLVFDQDRLQVQDLTAMTGGGRLKLSGYLSYQHGIFADLVATGKDVRVRYQGISSVADATLHLQGVQSNLLLSGNILLTRFAISPNLDLAALTSSSGGVSAPPDSSAPSSHVRLDVHITSSPELDFQNSYAKLAGDVDLRVGGTVAIPTVLGHISITDGSATFAGTQYQLQRGDIYFTNPVTIDPVIDLDATAHVEEYDITIGLHGTPSKLSFTYRSEPPLPQGDIFALLALGRTQEEQQIYSNQQQQAGVNSTADALLGGALNATVSSRIQKLFGGGNVKIDPTFVGSLGNSTARITVEQQVSKNATLTYATNVNSTAQQLIQGQIDLTHNVSLVAVRDESGVFSIVVKVRKRLR
ncbi:MAG TPA: translocation/assembly module TamB domain-containing protein [Acidisarcina sp.]